MSGPVSGSVRSSLRSKMLTSREGSEAFGSPEAAAVEQSCRRALAAFALLKPA